MSRPILILIALLALALAAMTALAVRRGVLGPPQAPAVATTGTALIGGPFRMTDQAGGPADQRLLEGKWSAVFFGFTNCPDACPTTLLALGQAEPLLGDKARRFQTVFVSVDPGRDTPEKVAAYLANESFPKRAVGLTGDPTQVDQIAKAYRIYHRRNGEGPDYVVDHSTITYLMTPKGQLACVIAYGATPEQIAAKVETAMRQGDDAQSC